MVTGIRYRWMTLRLHTFRQRMPKRRSSQTVPLQSQLRMSTSVMQMPIQTQRTAWHRAITIRTAGAGMQQAMARQIQTALITMTAILRIHMQTAAMAMTAIVQMILIPTTATVQMVLMMILLRTALIPTTATMQIVLIPVMLIIQAILIQTILIQTVLMPVKLMSPIVHTAQTVLIPTTATAKIRQQMLPMIPQRTLTILQRQPEAKRLLPQQILVI